MDFLPLIIRAEYRQGYRIRLTFNDGRQKTVDTNARAWLKRPPESLASAGAWIEPARPLGSPSAALSDPATTDTFWRLSSSSAFLFSMRRRSSFRQRSWSISE